MRALLGALLASGPAGVAGAWELRETFDFADAVARAEEYADRSSPADVLFVVDIDNTLMAMSHPLGSDQWFEWQEYLQKHRPDSPHLVGKEFPELLEAQGLLFTLGKMRPPQTNLPELVRRVQDRGVPTLVLTSRGEQFRTPTERELKACGYDFAPSAMKLATPVEGPFLPYDVNNLAAAGLTDDDKRLCGLAEAKTCTYDRGVLMTQGQHKGAMLLSILARAEHAPKAVVFVDDHGRHVQRVYDACVRHGIEAAVFHYRKEDDNVNHFRYGDKGEVTARWRRLESALKEVFELPEAAAPAAR
ncbi:MAG: DUF2608 domain-containing protein [Lacipirellulaceae bacterium]